MKKYFLFTILPLLFLMSCNKEKNIGSLQEKLFEKNLLNQNFVVSYADDFGTVLTSNYAGYIFILYKIDYYHGPMKAIKDGITYDGTWTANDDYGKLIITLPDTPSELKFLSRAWRFKSKSFSLLKLAPWGEGDGVNVYLSKE